MKDRAILIVDDNDNNLVSFSTVLKPTGRRIITCNSGKEALHILSTEVVSVILMDVQMPEMNGFEVADLIKTRKTLNDIPIIFISAAAITDDLISRGYATGAVDYLTKPIEPHVLLNKVEVFLKIADQRQEIVGLLSNMKEKNNELIKIQNKLIQSEKLIQASKLTSLGTMAAGMCHELNNPLAIIKGSADLLKKSYQLSDNEKKRLAHIHQSCERMRKIVDHLRAFARESKGDERTYCDLTTIISDSFQILQAHLGSRNITYSIDSTCDLLVLGDTIRLESIFHNLISNSRDAFTDIKEDRQKHLSFTCSSSDNLVTIVYEDNATGMPQDVIDRMFEPFFTTKEIGVGTGLGMSIAYGIVKEHNGQITVESELGKGTRFTLTFPGIAKHLVISDKPRIRKPDDLLDAKTLNSSTRDKVSSQRPQHSQNYPRVLVIDDEPEICSLIRDFIEDEFHVEICPEPKDFADILKNRKFDVILTDLKMPSVSGYEVIEVASKYNPGTPIIIMSGHARSDRDVEIAMKKGACELLLKPFHDEDTIKEMLHRIITSSANESTQELEDIKACSNPHKVAAS